MSLLGTVGNRFLGNRFKGAGLKSCGSGAFEDTESDTEYICPPVSFTTSQIRREVSNIADDILEPYIFNEDIGLLNVYLHSHRNIKANTLSLKDILINAFMGQNDTISRVLIRDGVASSEFLVNTEVSDNGTIDFGVHKDITPIKSVVFSPFFLYDEVALLHKAFCVLWNSYQDLEKLDKNAQKIIFRMGGYHALFTESTNDLHARISMENLELLKANVQQALSGKCAIIDKEDSFGVLSGLDVLNAVKGALSKIDIAYVEIARILKVPATRLLGRSPTGFNATGELDEKNYEKTLKKYRHGWVDPLLILMKIPYIKNELANIDDIVKLGNLIISLGFEESFSDLEGVVQSHIKSIGGKPFEDFDKKDVVKSDKKVVENND